MPLVAVLAVGAAVVVQAAGSALVNCTSGAKTVAFALTDATQTVKSVNMGLMERGPAPPPLTLASVVDAYIIEGKWDRLQPTANGPIDTSTIDRVVLAVRKWNAANPGSQRGLRLRIESGIYAPDWVKAMSGGPVTVKAPSGHSGTVARWWTQPVEDAYTAFIAKLAAYTDSIPEIREVTVGATMEFFGEIFVRFPTQNAGALTAAGFTQAADIAAMESSFRAHLAFAHTTTQIDVNGYQQLSGGGSSEVTQQLMNYALSIGLVHVQFANASLNVSGNEPLYQLMEAYGPKGSGQASITFQSMPNVSSPTTVINRALTYGASSIELPANPGTAAVLGPLDRAFGTDTSGGGGTSVGLTGVNTQPVGLTTSGTSGSSGKLNAGTSASPTLRKLASGAATAFSFAAHSLAKGKTAGAPTKVSAPAATAYRTAGAPGVC